MVLVAVVVGVEWGEPGGSVVGITTNVGVISIGRPFRLY